jgi:hypothetical protein
MLWMAIWLWCDLPWWHCCTICGYGLSGMEVKTACLFPCPKSCSCLHCKKFLYQAVEVTMHPTDFISNSIYYFQVAMHKLNFDDFLKCMYTDRYEQRWVVQIYIYTHKWCLLHTWSNWILHTPTFWSWLAQEGMWHVQKHPKFVRHHLCWSL